VDARQIKLALRLLLDQTDQNRAEALEAMKKILRVQELSNMTRSVATETAPVEQKEPMAPSKVALSDFPTVPAYSPSSQTTATEPLLEPMMESALPTYEGLLLQDAAIPNGDAEPSSSAASVGRGHQHASDGESCLQGGNNVWTPGMSTYRAPTSVVHEDPGTVSEPSGVDQRAQLDLWIALLLESQESRRVRLEETETETTSISACPPLDNGLDVADDDSLEGNSTPWPDPNSIGRFHNPRVWSWSLSLCSPIVFRPFLGVVSLILGWRSNTQVFDHKMPLDQSLSPIKAQLRYTLPSWIFGTAVLDFFRWNRMSPKLSSPRVTYFRELDDPSMEIAIRKADVSWIRRQINYRVLLPGDSVKGIGSPLEASCTSIICPCTRPANDPTV